MKNRFSLVTVLAALIALSISGAAVAKGILHYAEQAQEQDFAKSKPDRHLNIHSYGYQIKVLNPGLNPGRDRVVRIRDLGTEVYNLVRDLEPTSATLQVNDQPELQLQPNAQQELEAVVPATWLSMITSNTAVLTVYHNNQVMNSIKLEGMFF
jgi:hypothetical protein